MRDQDQKKGGLLSRLFKRAPETQAAPPSTAPSPVPPSAKPVAPPSPPPPQQPTPNPIKVAAQPAVSYSFNFKPMTVGGQAPAPAAPPATLPSTPPKDLLLETINLHKQGRLAEAETGYLKLIESQPANADVRQYLGMLYLQCGDTERGVAQIRQALALDPNHVPAMSNLGNALLDEQDHAAALTLFEKASQLAPTNAVIWYGKGRAHLGLGQLPQAVEDFTQTLSLQPNFPEAMRLLAKTHFALDHLEQAATVAQQALQHFPDDPHLNYFCGAWASSQNDHRAALAYLDKAVQGGDDLAMAWHWKGMAHQALHQPEQALSAFERCLQAKPEHWESMLSAALVCMDQGQSVSALKWLDTILERDPQNVLALAEKGRLLMAFGESERARDLLAQANQQLGNLLTVQFRHAIAGIPRLRQHGDSLEFLRSRLASELRELSQRIHAEPVDDPLVVVGEVQPFYLAYQELNNRDLLSQYGQLCVDLMQQWSSKQDQPSDLRLLPKPAGKRRVGILSAHIHEQSVWRAIVRGWVCELDRQRFELCIFYPGTQVDQQTRLAQERVDQFWQGEKSVEEWVRCIREANLDVLIYPELGMDALTAKLASLRLAPVQMASWGHPETTGLPTIDHYLSAELFESPQAQEHYSEKLVRLPNLGCYFESMVAQPEQLDLQAWGIDPQLPIYVCPGTPFKYMPEYDEALIQIAKRVPGAQFVFLKFSHFAPLTDLLMTRLKQGFNQAGLDPAVHLRLIPWQTRSGFYGLLKQANVFLDTMGFSGFNTVMHAIDCATPIVTLEGRFMRGRFGSAILHRTGLSEQVCHTVDQYVDLAVKLVQDAPLRTQMVDQITRGRDRLYRDPEPIRALESVLWQVTEPASA
ncbi:MAG TPA: tetratricopeptide repeat protein [Aquabacterium sp.]|nr:tetratricopeptide repeat protein [Aquabacterium sp.]